MVTSSVPTGTIYNNFGHFKYQFKTMEARFDAAQRLADPSDLNSPSAFKSRNFLAAHWGEDDGVLQGMGDLIYRLSQTKERRGQPVMVFTRGGSDTVFGSTEEDGLEDLIKLEFGVLSDEAVEYTFRPAQISPSKGVRIPFLLPTMGLPVRKWLSMEFDVAGDPEIEQKPSQVIPVCTSAVPLLFDLDLYQSTRMIREREVVLGQEACSNVFSALENLTERPGIGRWATHFAQAA